MLTLDTLVPNAEYETTSGLFLTFHHSVDQLLFTSWGPLAAEVLLPQLVHTHDLYVGWFSSRSWVQKVHIYSGSVSGCERHIAVRSRTDHKDLTYATEPVQAQYTQVPDETKAQVLSKLMTEYHGSLQDLFMTMALAGAVIERNGDEAKVHVRPEVLDRVIAAVRADWLIAQRPSLQDTIRELLAEMEDMPGVQHIYQRLQQALP